MGESRSGSCSPRLPSRVPKGAADLLVSVRRVSTQSNDPNQGYALRTTSL